METDAAPVHAGPPYSARHVVFSHGKESGPWGSKIRALAAVATAAGWAVDSIDYQGMADPAARVAKLVAVGRSAAGPLVLVGSSLGGHVCTAAALQLPTFLGNHDAGRFAWFLRQAKPGISAEEELARALLGKPLDAELRIEVPGGHRDMVIVAIAYGQRPTP